MKAKARGEQPAADTFQLYKNLLSVDVKYVWNKIFRRPFCPS